MIAYVLHLAFRAFVHTGDFSVSTADGGSFRVGDGTGEPLAIRFMTVSAELAVLLDPDLRFAELYVDGEIVLERGSLAGLLAMLLSQDRTANPTLWARPQWLLRYIGRRLKQFNSRNRAKANIAHHYDLDGRLYSIFLDASRQYSCAYFEKPDQTLDDAQRAKMRHVAGKLLLGPDRRVLDIGSGWGGLGCYLAENCGAQVDGVTLSDEQLEYSRARAGDAGCDGKIQFLLKDYRDLHRVYDRIVSVGMFEHVGRGFYSAFFKKCYELLSDDGVFLLHSCGRSDGPGITNPWLAKYIFPGGYIPALSEVLPAIERAGFPVTDIEILRLHYADTLKTWRERFLARRGEVVNLYDERFCRMWELYLASSEMAFREEGMMVFQIQMTKRQGVVPNTRDYIAENETYLRSKEANPVRTCGGETTGYPLWHDNDSTGREAGQLLGHAAEEQP
ncbi:cyclopropane-fatty-acyl-phospholipid synthase family protein [Afipia sp. Root123D2]|uniref:SAM-dependent methyltransferase n=1 Tax=Afipia sp. Root123D2 TaxID=1736436 RepID=UPI0009E6CD19|nr:cyclopropane-fatty-acyl-phospholipid synthase family protein [Afipia sp. Root123D2]